MKPFVQIANRPEDDVARTERDVVLDFSGLQESDLLWVQLDRDPFPDLHADDISGIILCGSPFTVSAPTELKSEAEKHAERETFAMLDRVIAEDIPFLGACYGIGTLGTHQGARVDSTYGESLGAIDVTLTEKGRADPLVVEAGLPETFTGIVGHKEAVHTLPDHATLLATGTASPVQMFRIGTRQYATQFHPELDAQATIGRARYYQHAGYFAPEDMEDIFAELSSVRAAEPPKLLRAFVSLFGR